VTGRRVIDYDDALTAARRQFVATGGLSMESLANDLSVSRATLYRVVGSRDRLLGDVLWQLARRTLTLAIQQVERTDLTGVDRLLQISHRFHEEVARFGPFRRLLQREPVDAFRILFTSSGRVHERIVQAWSDLLSQALEVGELDGLPFDVDETAYLFVRIGESILYGDMLAGIVPDGKLADKLRRSILASPS
jgi:AcrR family transcriptional regulator